MIRAVAVLLLSILLSAIVVVLGPGVAHMAFGKSIVADAQAVAAYVGTAVTIFSTMIGAGLAFVAYQVQKEDEARLDKKRRRREQKLKYRASALILKNQLRPLIREVYDRFETALDLIGKDRLRELREGKREPEAMFDGIDATKFVPLWVKHDTSVDLDIDTAEALAYLDQDHLLEFFAFQGAWQEAKRILDIQSEDDVSHTVATSALFYHIYLALDNGLKLNHRFNSEVLDTFDVEVGQAKSVDDWFESDNAPLFF